MEADQDRSEHQGFQGRVPAEPKDSSRIPFRIYLDDLYGSEYQAKEIFAFSPGSVVLFIDRLAPEFDMIDTAALVGVEAYLPDGGIGQGRAGELKSGEIRRSLQIGIRRVSHMIKFDG